MKRYILRRLLVAIPSLLIASLIVFSLPRLLPGDVVQLMLEEKAYGKDLDDLHKEASHFLVVLCLIYPARRPSGGRRNRGRCSGRSS